jgi:hypothetical protein
LAPPTAFCTFRLAFGLGLLVAHRLAGGFLHGTLGLVGDALNAIFVHGVLLF